MKKETKRKIKKIALCTISAAAVFGGGFYAYKKGVRLSDFNVLSKIKDNTYVPHISCSEEYETDPELKSELIDGMKNIHKKAKDKLGVDVKMTGFPNNFEHPDQSEIQMDFDAKTKHLKDKIIEIASQEIHPNKIEDHGDWVSIS